MGRVRRGAASKKDYDLMTLVVIRSGHKVYNGEKGDEGYDLLRFLNTIIYPRRKDFMEVIAEYVDFSENEELWKEAGQVNGLGRSILEEGIEKGIEKGIQAMIMENLEEQVSMEKIILKLQKHFGLAQEEAEQYYEKALDQAMAMV